MAEIKDVEIFAAGTWHAAKGGKVTVTEADLDAMVESFVAIGTQLGYRPTLKLGHKDSHRFFGGEKGAPNLGFVANVRRAGSKILADFVDVARPLFDLVKAGRYNQVSIEMLREFTTEGRALKNVLTGVAILGAEWPAVKGLADLRDALLSEAVNPVALGTEQVIELMQQKDEDMTTYTQEQHDALVEAAVRKAVDAAKAEFTATVTDLTAKLTAVGQRAETAEGALRQFQIDARAERIVALVDGAIKAGKLLPKQREQYTGLGASLTGKVKFGAEEKDGLVAFAELLDSMPKVVDLDVEKGAGELDGKDANGKRSAAEEIAAMASKALADKRATDYSQGYTLALSEASDDLKQRYYRGE